MSRFRKSLLITAIIISLPSLFLFYVGAATASLPHLSFWGGMLTLWWGTYIYLRKDGRAAFWLSFGLINLFWWPLLWRTAQRLKFIVENAGMESASARGSPAAFLLGFISEQLFFIPLCFALFFGCMAIKYRNYSTRKKSAADQSAL